MKDEYAGKASFYARGRPPYAAAPLATAMAGMGLKPDWVVGDIGSGTGNLARHFVGKVRKLYGVEPSRDMLNEQTRAFADQSAFVHLNGTSDRTGIPDESLDLIIIGQALHWFPVTTPVEFKRILKPTGWILTAWNDFGGTPEPDLEPYIDPESRRRLTKPEVFRQDWGGLFAGTLSASFAPRESDPGFDAFRQAEKKKFDRSATDGVQTCYYETVVVYGRPLWGTCRVG